jgi:hypothetical protein
LKKLLAICFATLLVVTTTSCGAGYQIHPGSIPVANDKGSFDSHTADALADLHAFLMEAARHQGDYTPAVTKLLSEANEYYTIAKNSYLQWRTLQTLDSLAQTKLDLQKAQEASNSFSSAQNAQKAGK